MTKKFQLYKNFIWAVILFTLPLPLIVAVTNGINPLYQGTLMSIDLGIYAYVWMLAVIFLSTRPKWIEKTIGLPDMYLIHGLTATMALVLLDLHSAFLQTDGLAKLTGEVSFLMYNGLVAYALIFLAGWLTSRVPLLKWIKQLLAPIFTHEVTIWIHRILIIATALIFVHVLAIDYISEINNFMFLFILYTIIAFAGYAWYLIEKNADWRLGTIAQVDKIDGNIVALDIALSTANAHNIAGGDFVFISFPEHKGLGQPHPFSILNHPHAKDHIILGIDGVGDFTRALNTVEPGAKVRVSVGYGLLNKLVKESDAKRQLVLIGGGIGIVPLLSLAQTFPNKAITMLYTVKQDKELLYQENFQDLMHRPNFD
jgi:predicted ferric reductase